MERDEILWTLFFAIVVAIPVGIAANRLDGRMVRWQTRRAERRSEKDARLRERMETAVDEPALAVEELIRLFGLGLFGLMSVVFGIGLIVMDQVARASRPDRDAWLALLVLAFNSVILGVGSAACGATIRRAQDFAAGMRAVRERRSAGPDTSVEVRPEA